MPATDQPVGRPSRQDLRARMLAQRYLRKDPSGQPIETTEQMFRRVAKAIAAVEERSGGPRSVVSALQNAFYRLMASGDFLPNSPTLMNAGREGGMLSACFVLPVPDSIDGIFEALKQTAQVQKAGGGTGFAFDALRPTGDLVASSGGTTSGPLSFMGVFASATGAIQQGAFRRGANMGMMSVHHPDILNFITAKDDSTAFENFNLSVKVTDRFMADLHENPGRPHIVQNPRTGERYVIPKTVPPHACTLADLLPADHANGACWTVMDLWNLIVSHSHRTGEPGICFIDAVNRNNPLPDCGRIEATNPCGEQPLLSNESCNLGSINLSRFVTSDGQDLDWRRLGRVIRRAVRFLDNVIDANTYPTGEIHQTTLAHRKIGLGVMGFADTLILRGIRYDSPEAETLARTIAGFLTETAHAASADLATLRGHFPSWPMSRWAKPPARPMRNAACTTVAPTGSISIIAGCSSGIEPIYSLATTRLALDGQEFFELHPLLERLGQKQGWLTNAVRQALARGEPIDGISAVPRRTAELFVTAHEVSPEWHVRIQAAWQSWIDSAVSKTVNLPAGSAIEDVDKVFRLAHKLGCKGITVYRDGSRAGQTLSGPSETRAQSSSAPIRPRDRVPVAVGRTFKTRVGCGTIFTTVNSDATGLCEVFAALGKAGGCPAQSEATARAVSIALRCGVGPAVLIDQLKGIRCLSTCVARRDNTDIVALSCPDAIARAIDQALAAERLQPDRSPPTGRPCPYCGQPMRRETGCFVCDRCLFNSCG
ncbi:adenosylcobalamin-dependent ribonucleoside-diphosphate reductase [Anaerobaca lacustris]|uniref:Vitamin B12-dependent ribonucleotide reductase n=1 Tax=Anaerobaca lacustris TaxID=3044600 RepID=A0AAW6U6Z3_9BACT|nr:adenosylcobalamin-dependent ribonucleoside-diphosphate reductase [Sedimentisphaerales bacterium M17dextr]